MATQVICDACGEPIDLTQPYFQVTATKVQVNNADDPLLPNEPVVVEIMQQFDYHDGHQPSHAVPPEEPPVEEPPTTQPDTLTLTELDPASAAKGSPVTLRLLGTGFNDMSVVVFGGAGIASTFVSDTELTCSPDTAALAKGAYSVLVSQDDIDTDALPFTVT
jgi:hypothetical protein